MPRVDGRDKYLWIYRKIDITSAFEGPGWLNELGSWIT